jgi:glycine oxidase
MLRTPDVLVVGGGVIGCAVARALAADGRRVLCVDRGAIGGEASSAAAGVLAVASGEDDGARLRLRRASLARFPALVAALAEESGLDVEWETRGVLQLALDDAEAAAAPARIAARRADGLRAEWLDRQTLAAAEPAANPAARGGVLFPDDAQVLPARLVAALAAAARRHGAEVVAGAEVRAAERAGDRLVRVRVNAESISPGVVVLAAGAWAPRVPDVAPSLSVVPARGQMAALRPAAPLCTHVLAHGDDYLVPRRSGEVWVGATVEDAGFEKAVTPEGLAALAAKAGRLAPAAATAPVARVWAGLRPYAPGGGPIVGRAVDTSNLVVACGHHRNGILLAPITADVVAALVAGRTPPAEAADFLPAAGRAA